jgi:hypothetical protein
MARRSWYAPTRWRTPTGHADPAGPFGTAAGPGPAVPATPVAGRLARLAGGVDRTRRRNGTSDVRHVMHLLGMTTIGFGIATVILGWYGAAHSPLLAQEIPYLISGGLLGVALVLCGGALYLASWLLRQIQEGHRDTQAVVRSLERLNHTMAVMSRTVAGIYDDEPVGNGTTHP